MFTHLYGVWNTDDTDGIDKHGLFLEEWDNRNDFPAMQKIDAYIYPYYLCSIVFVPTL